MTHHRIRTLWGTALKRMRSDLSKAHHKAILSNVSLSSVRKSNPASRKIDRSLDYSHSSSSKRNQSTSYSLITQHRGIRHHPKRSVFSSIAASSKPRILKKSLCHINSECWCLCQSNRRVAGSKSRVISSWCHQSSGSLTRKARSSSSRIAKAIWAAVVAGIEKWALLEGRTRISIMSRASCQVAYLMGLASPAHACSSKAWSSQRTRMVSGIVTKCNRRSS